MKKLFLYLLAIVLFSNLSGSTKVEAWSIPFEVIDLYASVSAYLRDGPAEDSLFEVERNGLSASIDIDFDLGLLSGTQAGEISASPDTGTVTVSGYSNTVLKPCSGGEYSSWGSWGKHVVVGSFQVPDTGHFRTDVYLDIICSGDAGAVFWIQELYGAPFDPNMFLPDAYTPWGGVTSSRAFRYSYNPGDTVYFAFGTEPGIGGATGGGCSTSGLTDSESVSATFQLSSDTPISLCKGDFDCDGDVDGSDLAVFAADFGRTDCLPE